jgi:hypothetical protein
VEKKLGELLASLPPKPSRSRLAPYAEFIAELRNRGWTYRGIAVVLSENCGVRASPSNVHHFVRISASGSTSANQRTMANVSKVFHESEVARSDLSERIADLKTSSRVRSPSPDTAFEFDTDEPLLIKKR